MDDRLEGQSRILDGGGQSEETAGPRRRLSVVELDQVTGGKAGDEIRREDGRVKAVL